MSKYLFTKLFKLPLYLTILLFITCLCNRVYAQTSYELNSGWKCAAIGDVKNTGDELSKINFNISGWLPATVPGTVLTTLLNNKKIPDPFFGLNNEQIPDIYKTGPEYYTYWFIKDFKEIPVQKSNQVYLNFRGVNYSCDIYLNGRKLNKKIQEGMFLRYTYNITAFLAKDGNNRLAVLVHPPNIAGNPNGGQGGDGTIARNVGLQYTAGWDWIQPVRDRNTGIWDKVTIQKTGAVRITDLHVVSLVPGIRFPDGPQKPAIIQVSAELNNAKAVAISGTVAYELGGRTISKNVVLKPASTLLVNFNDYTLKNPKLWWPNGYGPQNLYRVKLSFVTKNDTLSDQQFLKIGVRQLHTEWNEHTGSRQIAVNGQKIFIKGGNWIISDEMLRLSDSRYDAEVHFHRDMNLNLVRVWGGAMIERPEFYEACDKYGLLVFQDLWGSGDCNGRWQDPMKLDDQWTRRKYPDDHGLFLRSATLSLPKQSPMPIALNVNAYVDGIYQLKLTTIKGIPDLFDIWLMDNYKKDSLDIKHNSTYSFNVLMSDPASHGPKRFSLVIRQNPALGIHLLNFTAAKTSDGAQIIWKTENEQNYTNFTVERSTDGGVTFNVLGGFASSALGTYSFLDKAPPVAADRYRLKLEDLNGTISYSNVVTLMYANSGSHLANNNISVYPNPVAGTINLSILQNNITASNISSAANPLYNIMITNSSGSVIKTATSAQTQWQDNLSNLLPGTYMIQVVNANNKTVVGKTKFVKL
jgi:hypothetical protein